MQYDSKLICDLVNIIDSTSSLVITLKDVRIFHGEAAVFSKVTIKEVEIKIKEKMKVEEKTLVHHKNGQL